MEEKQHVTVLEKFQCLRIYSSLQFALKIRTLMIAMGRAHSFENYNLNRKFTCPVMVVILFLKASSLCWSFSKLKNINKIKARTKSF